MTRRPLDELHEDSLRRLAAGRLLSRRATSSTPRRTGRWPSAPGSGLEFREHRGYRTGDDARRIDWRVSQRRGRLLVRTFEDDRGADWTLCLDRSASMAGLDPRRWRLAVQVTAAVAYLALHQGGRVALAVFSDGVDHWCPAGAGALQYQSLTRLLGAMSARTSGGGSNLACVAPWCRSANVLVVSDFLGPDAMVGGLRVIQRPGRQVHAMHITSGADDAPVHGPAELVDVESGATLSVSGVRPDAAARSLQTLHASLADHCRRSGVGYSRSPSTRPWMDTLLEHLNHAEL